MNSLQQCYRDNKHHRIIYTHPPRRGHQGYLQDTRQKEGKVSPGVRSTQWVSREEGESHYIRLFNSKYKQRMNIK